MKQPDYNEVTKAEKAQNGGKYRLIAQQKINGRQCRCFARVFMVGDVAYWNVSYIIDGKEPERYNDTVRAMYEIAQEKVDNLCAKGQDTILWRY